jgi:uncharacterized protein involved in tolerance to divalent cations
VARAKSPAINIGYPYDVPEILAIGVIAGNASYLDWVVQETQTEVLHES